MVTSNAAFAKAKQAKKQIDRYGNRASPWVPLGYRHSGPAGDASTIDNTNTMFNQRLTMQAPAGADIIGLRIVWPRFNGSASWERNADVPLSGVTDSVIYNGVAYPVYWQGVRSHPIESGRGVMRSDPLMVRIPAGAYFSLGSFGSWTNNGATGLRMGNVNGFYEVDISNPYLSAMGGAVNEGMARGTSLSDLTLTTGNAVSNTGGGLYYPLGVEVMLSTFQPCVLFGGDSIITGFADYSTDPLYRAGYGKRGLANSLPWLALSKGSTTAAQAQNRPDGLWDASINTGVTDFVNAWGRNDINSGTSAATLRGYMDTIEAPFKAGSIRVWRATIPPTTTSTDSWATLANQTVANAGYEAVRLAYNADLRANWASYGLAGVIDLAASVESGGASAPSGKWRVDNGGANTKDGVHPNGRGHSQAISDSVISAAKFKAAAGI